jgi:hypothetical protein
MGISVAQSNSHEAEEQLARIERKLREFVRRSVPVLRGIVLRALKLTFRLRRKKAPVSYAALRSRERPQSPVASAKGSHNPPMSVGSRYSHPHNGHTEGSRPGVPSVEVNRMALNILCEAGTLSACARHGSVYMGSGDLAAAHRLIAGKPPRDYDDARTMLAASSAINDVFDKASRFYRCESCYGELKDRLTSG